MNGRAPRSHCPINFGLEAFADKWSLLIVRDIVFRGKRSYGEFLQSEERFATNILASRLLHLEQQGILLKEEHESDARRSTYRLTEKGLDLIPLLFEVILWSAKHDPQSEARRITGLTRLIRENCRDVSNEVMERVRNGGAVFPAYLDG